MRFMKIALLVTSLSLLSGCAGMAENALNLPSGVLTSSINNPVTKDDLYRVENGLIILVTGLKTYKKLCSAGTIDSRCVAVVTTLQGYSKKARPLIRALRTFVRKNDQVNAGVAFRTLQQLISDFRSTAAANGIQLPATQ